MKRLFVLALVLFVALTACGTTQTIREVIVVTATPRPPTPQPVVNAEDYMNWAISWSTDVGNAFGALSDAAYREDTAGVVSNARTILALCKQPVTKQPPPAFAETHRYLILACEENTAAAQLTIQGVEDFDIDALDAAIAHVDMGTYYMGLATDAIP